MKTSHLRVADVFRAHWPEYCRTHPVAKPAGKAVRHILQCRTAALGGHLYRCDACGSEVPLYNSCRDKHCPTCQTTRKQQWIQDRRAELLPVPYFHAVFTLPHDLHPLIGVNRRLLLDEFFSAVNWVLQHFAADPQWKLNGQLGFIAVLHTWTQKLLLHYHLHCLIPGGAWNAEAGVWQSAHSRYLFGKDALAKAFQSRFIRRLNDLRRRERLTYDRDAADLATETGWTTLLDRLWKCPWIVYPKATVAGAEHALDYLARYTHRVAISNHRILSLQDSQVTFAWRDRADQNQLKAMTLPAEQFMARFLLHILPGRFAKIRYFGWLGARNKRTALTGIRTVLDAEAPSAPPSDETPAGRILRLTGVDVTRCPICKTGHLTCMTPLPCARDGPT